MPTSELLQTLTSYVPALIARRLRENPAPLTEPAVERFPAAVFFADISGFTRLAERLAQQGPAGAEELSHLLNDYFGRLISIVTAHGGDVFKFAGDALLALWPIEEKDEGGIMKDEEKPSTFHFPPSSFLLHPSSLSEATRQAAQCGLAVQSALHNYEAGEEVRLSLRIGLAAGEVVMAYIGGVDQRWEVVVSGLPLTQVSAAERQALPGQVVIAPEAWELIRAYCLAEPVALNQVEESQTETPPAGQILKTVYAALPLPPSVPFDLKPEMEAALQAYIPGAIIARLAAGQTGWLAELRRVTVAFINLPELSQGLALQQAQTLMRTLQTALYRYEGSINKLNVDDKGVTLVAALGLPPLAHEDDAVRALQAALEIKTALQQLGVRNAIGITSGRAFCGSVGDNTRREYTMIGDVVNLAARLMQAAPDDILCDAATAQAAQGRLAFEALPAITVKGKVEPVAVYRPSLITEAERRGRGKAKVAFRSPTTIVGRTAERKLLADELQAFLQGGPGGVIIIEGEPGIGKSRLVDDLRRQAEALRLTVFSGAADAVEKSTTYFAWRSIFNQLYDLGILTNLAARRQHILDLLELEEDLLPLAPLLNGVLLLDLPDTDVTAQMTGQVRADNTRDLLLRALQESAARSPKIVILEDAHWLDSASWALALHVIQHVKPLLLIMATRPPGEAPPDEYRQVLSLPGVHHLVLSNIAPEDIEPLICQRLGITEAPPPMLSLIQEKAEGNPFFTEELAYALRDSGLVLIADGEAHLAPEAGDLRLFNFPDTVQGVITSRIDRLAPAEQLTLKVASVIGRVFAFRTLQDVHPIEADKPRLADHLQTLEHLDLTPLDTPEPDLSYIFKHIITQEVAYNLMLFAQRQTLHQAVAEFYERAFADDLSPFYPILAHHWDKAGERLKTIDYLEKASEQALRAGVYQEAIGFFDEILRLDNVTPVPKDFLTAERAESAENFKEKTQRALRSLRLNRLFSVDSNVETPASDEPAITPLRRARWHRALGEAHYGLGHLAEGRAGMMQALALLGYKVSTARGRLVTSVLSQVVKQVWHTLFPVKLVHGLEREHLLEAVRAYALLGEISYFTTETFMGIACVLSSLNLAEALGPSPELAGAYANNCVVASFVPLRPLAEFYSRRAQATARAIQHHAAQAHVFNITGIYFIGVGQWEHAHRLITSAAEASDQLRDRRQWIMSQAVLALQAHYQSRFTQAAELNAAVYTAAQRTGNLVQQGWGLYSGAENMTRLGRLPEALALLDQALGLPSEEMRRAAQIRIQGILAVARWRQEEWELARAAAETASDLIARSAPGIYSAMEAYTGVAEVYLAMWEKQRAAGEHVGDDLRARVRQACRVIRRYAHLYPVGQPRAWLWNGLLAWLEGNPGAARRAWSKSLAQAQRLVMPYEEGLAHYEIARHLNPDDSARQPHVTRACEIFAELNAAFDLERAQKLAEDG
jgi:class 3 adenylate cyclase/tetratricopeptide (TPR) repeat protein